MHGRWVQSERKFTKWPGAAAGEGAQQRGLQAPIPNWCNEPCVRCSSPPENNPPRNTGSLLGVLGHRGPTEVEHRKPFRRHLTERDYSR